VVDEKDALRSYSAIEKLSKSAAATSPEA